MHYMILRIKNIIFFKIVCITLSVIIMSYIVKIAVDDLSRAKYKQIKATQLVDKSNARLIAINDRSGRMDYVVQMYMGLKIPGDQNVRDCFDKATYKQKIQVLSKEYETIGEADIRSSQSFVMRQEKSNNLYLTTKRILLDARLESLENSILLAKNAFDQLPRYNLLRSCEIKLINTITPSVSIGKIDSNIMNLVRLSMNMEVKELHLNE